MNKDIWASARSVKTVGVVLQPCYLGLLRSRLKLFQNSITVHIPCPDGIRARWRGCATTFGLISKPWMYDDELLHPR
jgi:hypothetical protein